jgi:hypothetical protein
MVEEHLPEAVRKTADPDRLRAVWTPPIGRGRTEDGRPVFVYNRTRYVEVPVGSEDLYRYLAELRLEMDAASFRALIERNRASIGGVVLWRLGLDAQQPAVGRQAPGGVPRRLRERVRQVFEAA